RLSCVPLAYELVLRIEERAIEWPRLVEAVAKVRDRSAQVAIGFAVGKVRVLYQLDPPDTGCDLEQVPEDLRVSAEGGHGLANLRGGWAESKFFHHKHFVLQHNLQRTCYRFCHFSRRRLPADIGRPHACRERLPHRPLQVARG